MGQLLTEDGPFASDTVTDTCLNRLRACFAPLRTTGQLPVRVRVLTETLLACGAFVMSHWVEMEWPFLAGLAVLAIGLVAGGVIQKARADRMRKCSIVVAWAASVISLASLFGGKFKVTTWDFYHAVVLWLVATAVLLAGHSLTDRTSKAWTRGLGMVWGFCGVSVCLAVSYSQNRVGAFYFGLLVGFVSLILCKFYFRLPAVGIQIINTLILLFASLPLVDLLVAPADHFGKPPEPEARAYSYDVAKNHRAAFVRWWEAYEEQVGQLFRDLYIADASGGPRLRPNSKTVFFQSRISINSKGFRGEEVPEQKGSAYRIVTIGESTTFGFTMNVGDKPWPEELEQMIREQLRPSRQVQVINAGVPGNNLKENVGRLPLDILPLKPDMIISYHGVNGFHFLYEGLPPVRGKGPPPYKRRPVKLLADAEHGLALNAYKRRHFAMSTPHPAFRDPMDNEYARAYRELIQIARTNGIRLVLATYSMAVNDRSAPAVVEFYEELSPSLPWLIKANAVHSDIVKQLAREYREVRLVDTQPDLDGHYEAFADVVHFEPCGELRMAQTIFSGIRNMLEEDLDSSRHANQSSQVSDEK